MKASISGFKKVGSWDEIVEHGKIVTELLREKSDREEEIEEWEEWRPKEKEQINQEIADKTAEKASVDTEDAVVTEEAKKGSKKIATAPKEAVDEDVSEAGGNVKEGVKHVTKAADSASRKFINKIEKKVYKKVMTRLGPYYFDNNLVSANINKKKFSEEEKYALEININDDETKREVKEELENEGHI